MRRSAHSRPRIQRSSRPMPPGVPWVARERRPSFLFPSRFARALLTTLLSLVLDALPVAAQTPDAPAAPPANTSAEPVVAAPAGVANPASATNAPRAAAHAASVTPPPAPPARIEAPSSLRHVQEWVDYRTARHLSGLPMEARIYYRRGLQARLSGQLDEAFADVRGAAELDPTFVEPHLTLASWWLLSEPSQALLQYASALELLRQNFNFQLNFAANALLLALQALFVGLLLASVIVVVSRRDELTHAWQEQLRRFASKQGARWWSWGILILAYASGFGITLPTLGFFGYLWPSLRVRERALFCMLLAASLATPFAMRVIERLSLPMHDESAPFYGVPTLAQQPFSAAREARLREIAAREPGNPLVQFGLAWVARRGNDLATSEQAYRAVLEKWPNDDRALNNLGNVIAMRGRIDDAIHCYERAISANPANAAAYFNASQLHTQRYEYEAASAALKKASALNFELVKTYQSQASADGLLPLVDQWLTPEVFWNALAHAPLPSDLAGSIPLALRGNMETRGWRFTVLALLVAILGLAAGILQHGKLHLRTCGNCGRIVCRRCSQRRREQALCPACVAVEATAETADFSRLLLMRHRQERNRRRNLLRTVLAALIPGYGLLAHRRVFTAIFLLGATWLLVGAWRDTPPPFAIEPRLALPGQDVPAVLLIAGLACVYGLSLLGYFRLTAQEREREAALNAASRGRITQSTRRASAIAA